MLEIRVGVDGNDVFFFIFIYFNLKSNNII